MIAFNFSCANHRKLTKISNEGKIMYNVTQYNVNPADDVKDYTFHILYLDSTVILEYVQIEFEMGVPLAKRSPAVLKTKKIVFIDLKNLHCQDYRKLDTTETPIANYQLTPNEILQWNFYSLDSIPINNTLPFTMSDTIIGNKTYKRIFFENNNLQQKQIVKRIIYMTDQYSQNLFHVSVSLDKKYSPFRVMRFEDYVNGIPAVSLYYDELSNKLTDFERKVFEKWKNNAKHITLPLLTQDQALRIN